MADETTQTGEDTSWWDLDIFADSELPSTSFDEPLEWPEALDWGDPAPDGALQFPGTVDLESEPIFPPTPDLASPAPEAPAPEADTQWQATGGDGGSTMTHVTVLSGLGGGADASPPVAQAGEQTAHERLPESLWGGAGGDQSLPPVVTTTMAAPGFSTEPGGGGGGWRRRFDIRHGNAATIALISLVSLILLGMFMSVRARNQLPDTSQTRTTSDRIQVQGTLNTVPPTTTVTTTVPAPAPAINIADLVPPEESTTATTGAGSGGSAPATTAAPRAAGGTSATPASTATTAAPQTTAPPETTTPTPSPDDTTAATQPRVTTTMPAVTTPTTEFPMPSIPSDFTIPSTPRRGF